MRRRLSALLCSLLAILTVSAAFGATATAGSPYRSYAYLAISRTGAAVYVNALVHQDSATGLTSGANRTVYLQRQLSGQWQNVLFRHTDVHGRFTVGFLSAPSYSYRLVVLAGTNALSATSGAAASPLLGGVLHPGQSLQAGTSHQDALSSPSGRFSLSVSWYGTFTLEQNASIGNRTIDGLVQQITGQGQPTGAERLTMLTNGDLALITAGGKPIWSSHLSGPGNSLYVQDDGNLVIYSPQSRAVWASHTTAVTLLPGTSIPSGTTYLSNTYPQEVPSRTGRLSMQHDGNLVLYGQNKLIWQSNTHIAGSHAAFTVNGTLAVYSPAGTTLWHSKSYGVNTAMIINCGSIGFSPPTGQPQYFPIPQYPFNCGT